jgi:hydrogenase-1 operon protein HyaE
MFSPLTQMLLDDQGYTLVDESNVDSFLNSHEHSVLFFPGDAERLAESDDVAVILPELIKAFGGRIIPAVVARGESERALQRRFRFNAFPTLVFLRGDGYLGTISRVQDWQDYVRDIGEIFAREASDPPAFEFPKGCFENGMAATAGDNTKSGDTP